MDWMYTLSGFVVGAIVGLTGVGGGSLMTPLLVLLFGIHPATAVGTDLLYAAITKAGGTVVHARKGHVDWRITRLLASGSIPAALLTSGHFLAAEAERGRLARHFRLARCRPAAHRRRDHLSPEAAAAGPGTRRRCRAHAVAGADHGRRRRAARRAGDGLVGRRRRARRRRAVLPLPRLPTIRIVGSDVAHAVPLTLVAGLGHWLIGSVDWSLLGSLLLGSLPGIWLGSHASAKVPDRILRPILAGMLVLIGGKLIAQ
jgi:uncharacterized membrane protein YfcA